MEATNLAAAIIQLAVFTKKVLSATNEYYRAAGGGNLVRHADLRVVTDSFTAHLRHLSDRQAEFQVDSPPARTKQHGDKSVTNTETVETPLLWELAKQARHVANELFSVLRELSYDEAGGSHLWSSIRQAVLSTVKEGQLRDLETRMESLRDQIDSALLHDLR